MANEKYTAKQWEKAREYFEAGLSIREVSAKTGISKSPIAKKAKDESWSKGTDKGQLIAEAARVEAQKGQLTDTALEVHNELVDERVRHIKFFNAAAIQNVREAMTLQCETQQDHRFRAETISKGRETVLGKQSEPSNTTVNVNNQAGSVSKIELVSL